MAALAEHRHCCVLTRDTHSSCVEHANAQWPPGSVSSNTGLRVSRARRERRALRPAFHAQMIPVQRSANHLNRMTSRTTPPIVGTRRFYPAMVWYWNANARPIGAWVVVPHGLTGCMAMTLYGGATSGSVAVCRTTNPSFRAFGSRYAPIAHSRVQYVRMLSMGFMGFMGSAKSAKRVFRAGKSVPHETHSKPI